ncbi:MAG: hypothetical protein J4N87_04185 [Chloroflexi bacterium]|nr:hypothetical protein [Chloroflexota bacterium]
MTTTTNIQAIGNAANRNTDNKTEEGTMNNANDNINLVARISNVFRMENFSRLIAGGAVGLALTIGVAMPGPANADVPSVTNPGSYLTDVMNDDFSLVYGVPDAPAKLVKTSAAINMVNDDFSLVYGTPDAPAKAVIATGQANPLHLISEENEYTDFTAKAVIKTGQSNPLHLISEENEWTPAKAVIATGQANPLHLISEENEWAPAKVKVASTIGTYNDDFSMVFGTPDNVA